MFTGAGESLSPGRARWAAAFGEWLMKRLFVTAALLPLALASAARAETKIATATTAPVKTSTAASGAPDDLTIDTGGSVKPTAAGAAVTLDSNNAVKNAGTIGFNNVSNAV